MTSDMLTEARRLVEATVDPRDREHRNEALRAARVCMESRRDNRPCPLGECFVCTVFRLWHGIGEDNVAHSRR